MRVIVRKVRPWAMERIAASKSASTADLATYPDAPAASAARRYEGSSCMVRTSTRVCGHACRRPSRILRPPPPGMVRSSVSTSGLAARAWHKASRSEEHTSELQSHLNLVCRLLLEKKKKKHIPQELIHSMRDANGRIAPVGFRKGRMLPKPGSQASIALYLARRVARSCSHDSTR